VNISSTKKFGNLTKSLLAIAFPLLLSAQSLFCQSGAQYLKAKIDSLLTDDYFSRTLLACEIYDMQGDSVLYRKDEKMLLHPASNMKILTTSTALYFLGPKYEFKTYLYYDGEIRDGVLHGNIYLKGGFDPDFTTEDLRRFAQAIESYGIETIQGNIYGDVSNMDSLFWGNGWMWDDDPYMDFPYMTPLNVNDDCVQIIVTPKNKGEKPLVEIFPHSLFYTFENNALTTDTTDLRITRDWINRKNHFTVSGTIQYNALPDTVERNLVNTNLYAITLLKEILYSDGVNCLGILDTGRVPTKAVLLDKTMRPFDEVILNLNKNSDNLSAEMTLRALGFEFFGAPSSAEKGIRMIDSLITLAGFDPEDYRIVDGSGVSHYNLITPELIVGIFTFLNKNRPELLRILKDSFPVAGMDGTLKNRMKNSAAFGNVRAKTGTLSGVSTLSGFVNSASGKEIAFSIFLQNFTGSAKMARDYQDKICEIMAEMR
jgi:D-alanyl-D-alanine carboxypeptidase/D-alanyl-D-alanine-endopeptidase (penicillin-binding protein 4)